MIQTLGMPMIGNRNVRQPVRRGVAVGEVSLVVGKVPVSVDDLADGGSVLTDTQESNGPVLWMQMGIVR
jgi:hypothetical protein